jgi:hypothetical protein
MRGRPQSPALPDCALEGVPTEKAVRVVAGECCGQPRIRFSPMTSVVLSLLWIVGGFVQSRAALHLEVLALRHQLQVLHRSRPQRLGLGATKGRAQIASITLAPCAALL